jgi:membrane-associated protease RseP (regulator of RpoE activity)
MGRSCSPRRKTASSTASSCFPIGASVRFAGEFDDDDQDKHPDHFFNRPRWARALVIGTGPALNLLSGVLAFFIMFVSFGYRLPVLDTVPGDSQAAAAGLEAGQRIVRVNGKPVRTTLDYSGQVMFCPVTSRSPSRCVTLAAKHMTSPCSRPGAMPIAWASRSGGTNSSVS